MIAWLWIWVCIAGCLCGALCCACQRTTQRTAVWPTEACIQPTPRFTKNTPSRVRNCTGGCRGTASISTAGFLHLYNLSAESVFPFFRVLSALAHWAAIFREVEYLPLIAFPFVKLFQNNPLLCFEVVATVIGTCEWINLVLMSRSNGNLHFPDFTSQQILCHVLTFTLC